MYGVSEDKIAQLVHDCFAHDRSSGSHHSRANISSRASGGNNHIPAHVLQEYNAMQTWLNTPTDQQPYHNVASVVGLGTQEGSSDIELEIGDETGDWWSTTYFNMGK